MEICSFAFWLKYRWEDQYCSNICMANMELLLYWSTKIRKRVGKIWLWWISESSHLILIKKANTPVTHTIKITQIDCWVQVDLDFDKSHPLLACTCTLLQTKRTPFGSGPQQQWPPQNSRNGMSRTTETEALTWYPKSPDPTLIKCGTIREHAA